MRKLLLVIIFLPVLLQAQPSGLIRHLAVDSISLGRYVPRDAVIYRESARKIHIKNSLVADSLVKGDSAYFRVYGGMPVFLTPADSVSMRAYSNFLRGSDSARTIMREGLYLPLSGGTMLGNILSTDSSYTLGDATHRFRDLFLARDAYIGKHIALGTANQLIHPLAIGGPDSLIGINIVRTDKNTVRNTYAQATDTSVVTFDFYANGAPKLYATDQYGNVVWKFDNTSKLTIKGNLVLNQITAPTAPTVAINATAGNLNGSYLYRITFVSPAGETEGGTVSSTVAPVSQKVDLSAIPVSTDGSVTARNIYRTAAGGSNTSTKLVATISDNTTTTYTDNIADGSLGTSQPAFNTTGAIIYNGPTKIMLSDVNNTLLGWEALKVNTGFYNMAVGFRALWSNTTGTDNMGIGTEALKKNTTGNRNVGIGSSSLAQNQTGGANVAIGSSSLANLNGTSYNIAIGEQSLSSSLIGSNNTVVGTFASYYNKYGSSLVAIGYQAGDAGTVLRKLDNSVFLGQDTKSTVDSVTNVIALGYQAAVSKSNQAVIGNTSITEIILRGRLVSSTAAPSIAAGAGAGTSPTISVSGSSVAGKILLTTGTTPTANGIICTVTLGTTYTAAPQVVFSPATAGAALAIATVYVTSTTTTIILTNATTALPAATQCDFFYHVIQ